MPVLWHYKVPGIPLLQLFSQGDQSSRGRHFHYPYCKIKCVLLPSFNHISLYFYVSCFLICCEAPEELICGPPLTVKTDLSFKYLSFCPEVMSLFCCDGGGPCAQSSRMRQRSTHNSQTVTCRPYKPYESDLQG